MCSLLWQRIYTSEFGNDTWEPKISEQCAVREDTAKGEDCPASRWKKLFFKSMIGQEMNKWRKDLKHTSPYTGLPRQTEWVLRSETIVKKLKTGFLPLGN